MVIKTTQALFATCPNEAPISPFEKPLRNQSRPLSHGDIAPCTLTPPSLSCAISGPKESQLKVSSSRPPSLSCAISGSPQCCAALSLAAPTKSKTRAHLPRANSPLPKKKARSLLAPNLTAPCATSGESVTSMTRCAAFSLARSTSQANAPYPTPNAHALSSKKLAT